MSGEKTGLILAGGPLNPAFAESFIRKQSYSWIVTADAGLSVCMELSLKPNLAVGDFDTLGVSEWKKSAKTPDGSLKFTAPRRMKQIWNWP